MSASASSSVVTAGPHGASGFLVELFSKRVVLVTGKGGVGRSCVTAALARVAAQAGRRVLVADIGAEGDDYSPLAKIFGRERFPTEPEALAPASPADEALHGVTLFARAGQELFLASVLHNASVAKVAMSSDAIRKLLSAGPSFREMGLFFQLLTYLRKARADGSPEHELILVDMPATGHTLSLTGLPELLLGLVATGPIADALREGQRYLNDPATGGAYIVTLPETLPVSESLELLDGLAKTSMPAGGIIVNRIPTDPFTPEERAALSPVVSGQRVFGGEAFAREETCRREIARLVSQTSLPILQISDYPGTTSAVRDIAAELDGHRRGGGGATRDKARQGATLVEAEGSVASVAFTPTIPPGPDDLTIASLLETKRILVCCGAGGVGKTTTAAALSLAAARMGRRVLVLTIDPSRRLAETLGVTRNPPEPVPLPEDRRAAANIQAPGSLEAWMLDPKLVADESVRRLTRTPEEAERVISNRIYQKVSSMVAGMHEYTAMEALHRLVNSGKYDLVILDTPPSRNALDFLEAPKRLSSLIDGRVFRAFLPGGGLVARAASNITQRILRAVFGEEFAGELSVFMGTFSTIFAALNVDVSTMREFLSQPDSAFLLVTSPAPETLTEAHFFRDKTHELGLPFRGYVLNRSRARTAGRAFPERALLGEDASPAALAGLGKLQLLGRAEQVAAQRDRDLLAELRKRAGGEALAVAVPNLSEGADDMATLLRVSDMLVAR
jgi:anion-transporting  ArsA/GET3 family ATPase